MTETRDEPDRGAADPAVTVALAGFEAGVAGPESVVTVLAESRLLVPVVAVLDQVGASPDGLRVDKSSHMATVSTTGRDGRRGLLAFTCLESLLRWDPKARPVPAPTPAVAAAAVDAGANALVVDIAGPVLFAIEGSDLQALADRWTVSS
ncbi:MAG TPA: SseB family protein [Jiangellaceae bacterium]|jgi:SseB protein N-terminal domain|nr:SseB family protein [Jiangellaceae bacterium]